MAYLHPNRNPQQRGNYTYILLEKEKKKRTESVPKEGPHCKVSLVLKISEDGEAILSQQAVKLPLCHRLVILSLVPRILQGHTEDNNTFSIHHHVAAHLTLHDSLQIGRAHV